MDGLLNDISSTYSITVLVSQLRLTKSSGNASRVLTMAAFVFARASCLLPASVTRVSLAGQALRTANYVNTQLVVLGSLSLDTTRPPHDLGLLS